MTTTAQYQRALVALGRDPGKVDGELGPRTFAALEDRDRGPIYLHTRHTLPRPKHYSTPRAPRKIQRTILHWPGGRYGAAFWARYFAERAPIASVHWVVDETGAYQVLEHTRIANHAKGHNLDSIGVEICQYPFFDEKGNADAIARGLTVTKSPIDPQYATLDPRIERNVVALCTLLGLHVTDHAHNSTTGKIDVVPWLPGVLAKLPQPPPRSP